MLKIVADDKIPFLRGVLEPYAEMVYLPGGKITRSDLADADALLTRTRTKCDAALLDGAKVKFIASATIGFDHIDVAYCESHGITWTNAPGCNAESAAQYLTSLLLTDARLTGRALAGRTIGVIGAGNVGSRVARNAAALGMKVLLHDPPRARREGPQAFTGLDVIRREADFITFHVPLIRDGEDATFHYADAAFFRSLDKHAFVINSSRGEVCDNQALKTALKEKQIRGAALDVWENEPEIDLELLDLLNFATPHIAGYSADGKANGTAASILALVKFFGLEKKFDPARLLRPSEPPSPDLDLTTPDLAGMSETALLWRAVTAAYDIIGDDSRLRSEPGKFEQWRGNYPLRREFDSFTVTAPPRLAEKLRQLRFTVRQKEKLPGSRREKAYGKLRRAFYYYYNKAMREKGSPEYIARGWTIGVFIGFAVPFSFQLMISIPLSFLLQGSKLGAALGTFVTNHVTILLIYPFQCWLGNQLIRGNLSLEEITRALSHVFKNWNGESLSKLGMEMLLSFLLGGLVLAVVFAPVCYCVTRMLVVNYRARREKLRQHRRAKPKKASSHGMTGRHLCGRRGACGQTKTSEQNSE